MDNLYEAIISGGSLLFTFHIKINPQISFKHVLFADKINTYITEHLQQFLKLMFFDSEAMMIVGVTAKKGVDESFVKSKCGIGEMKSEIFAAMMSAVENNQRFNEEEYKKMIILRTVRKITVCGIFETIKAIIKLKNERIQALTKQIPQPIGIDISIL